MSLTSLSDPFLKQAFKTEIQVMKQVQSEHCVRIFDVIMNN